MNDWSPKTLPQRAGAAAFAAMLAIAATAVAAAGADEFPREEPEPRAESAATQPAAAPSEYAGRAIRRRVGDGSAAAQTQPAAKAPGGLDAAKVAMALGVVIAVIFALRWLGRKTFAGPGGAKLGNAVQVLGRTPLGPRQQLLLIRVGRRVVLAADSGGQMSALCEISDPDEVAALAGQVMERPAPSSTGTPVAWPHEPDDDGLAGAREVGPRVETELDPTVRATREELSGLLSKVRFVSRQFKGS